MKKIKDHSLYLLISEEYGRGRSILEIAKAAIAGGVDIIQLREKKIPKGDLINVAGPLSALCKKKNVTFIINDDPILAKEVDADGVHLGQKDLKLFKVNEARSIVGRDKIIGVSASSIKDVEEANEQDINYIGFGPVFPTVIKDKCAGTKDVEKVLEISTKPVFFIGGINLINIDELLAKGAQNVAVIRAILEADDVMAAAKALKERLNRQKNGKIA